MTFSRYKERVISELNAVIEKATDVEKWSLTDALKAVQNTVADTGIPGALWNAIFKSDVFPTLSTKIRQEILTVVSHVDSLLNKPCDDNDDGSGNQ